MWSVLPRKVGYQEAFLSVSYYLRKGLESACGGDTKGKEVMATTLIAGTLEAIATGYVCKGQPALRKCIDLIQDHPYASLLNELCSRLDSPFMSDSIFIAETGIPKDKMKTLLAIGRASNCFKEELATSHNPIKNSKEILGLLEGIRKAQNLAGDSSLIGLMLDSAEGRSSHYNLIPIAYSLSQHGLVSDCEIRHQEKPMVGRST